ncbi:FIST N-terminal domain-containing protein [Stigmatella sp. ncwal1]|uniref:FIST N-terminal domain-containing protein n=1 Tax=Stigmatella ashevillensis TaxID=2995309 RepID=A0ABT5CZU0_9BACT|nr:FIST N-terminal domain-containing protein [Stigmatella ashevillena]MDC0706946.1 FIST N-terminal domain-containing protein [Stigmatella ashevillena]
MKVAQKVWTEANGWQDTAQQSKGTGAHLVLLFGARAPLQDAALFRQVRSWYPEALIVGCSTAGEICGTEVLDASVVATAVWFEHTRIHLAQAHLDTMEQSHDAGASLAKLLHQPGLSHVLVLSDGLKVNGTELVRGLREHLPRQVALTGGLAGDGPDFLKTVVCCNSEPMEGGIAAVGFYGERLRIGYGSLGGWDAFGPERLITRAKSNVLYELDGHSALELYKQYLGEHATGLPATALRFPLSLRSEQEGCGLVRTVLSINEQEQSMTFAGDMPEGAYARLMKANFDRLIDGAAGAAREGIERMGSFLPELAVLISCVGRKLVLKQRVEEEVEGVREVLGPTPVLTGFYSYGEICPNGDVPRCELHNQTMTITAFSES